MPLKIKMTIEEDEHINRKEMEKLGENFKDMTIIKSLHKKKITLEINTPVKHSCSYCKVEDILSVAKCLSCTKWFCNGSSGSNGSSPSHIINHLMNSGHKEVSLPKGNDDKGSVLKCSQCDCTNIFNLGNLKCDPFDESRDLILCRQPCALNSINQLSLNIESWLPLITDRRLLPSFCKFPIAEQETLARNLSNKQIKKLEDTWKSENNVFAIDLDKMVNKDKIFLATKFIYSDPFEFKSIMNPLIDAEETNDMKQKKSQVIELLHLTL